MLCRFSPLARSCEAAYADVERADDSPCNLPRCYYTAVLGQSNDLVGRSGIRAFLSV
jgi:hypothetical protein